ncbi:MAG: 4'-phosphopantetheinyl transferase superfamily protein [Clostridiales bacterium]|jgi:phosphopantetheinyl transferase|nr:4'-phosphopantetheinyl transferase superfamily protein [Clostridiales bacterium]
MKPKVYAVNINQTNLCKVNGLNTQNDRPGRHREDLSLVGQALRRYAINKEFEIPYNKMVFSINEAGKPFLKGYDNVSFNVSHSGDICVCAVFDKEVGIDIQIHNKGINTALAKKYFTVEENKALALVPEEKRVALYFDLWAKHESLVKYFGVGIAGLGTASENGRIFEFSHQFEGYSLCLCR